MYAALKSICYLTFSCAIACNNGNCNVLCWWFVQDNRHFRWITLRHCVALCTKADSHLYKINAFMRQKTDNLTIRPLYIQCSCGIEDLMWAKFVFLLSLTIIILNDHHSGADCSFNNICCSCFIGNLNCQVEGFLALVIIIRGNGNWYNGGGNCLIVISRFDFEVGGLKVVVTGVCIILYFQEEGRRHVQLYVHQHKN